MRGKSMGKSLLMHGTAAAMSLCLMLGTVTGSFACPKDKNSVLTLKVSAEESTTKLSGSGQFTSEGNTYTYEYTKALEGTEVFKLKSVKVGSGQRTVNIPRKVYADGAYHTVTALGTAFGRDITADTVKMPNSITLIESDAFLNAKVGTIYVSAAVRKIGSYFCCSRKIGKIEYSGTQLEELGAGAFSGSMIRCYYGLKENSHGAVLFGNWLIRYVGGQKNVKIKEIGEGTEIKRLGPDCFSTEDKELNSKLETVDLTGVDTVSASAFSSNPNLKAITGTSSIKHFDTSAVSNTKWFETCKSRGYAMIGEVLIYYRTDGDTIDISLPRYSCIRHVNSNVFSDCSNASIMKIHPNIVEFDRLALSNGKNIDTIYIGDKKIEYDDNDQFLPDLISDNFETFRETRFVENFRIEKTKRIFKILGIKYFGINGKGGVSSLSNESKFEAAFKLHEYITTNFVYGADPESNASPYIDGKSTIVCQNYAELYAYLLESAGINAEVVSSTIRDSKGNITYNGNHAWNILEIGGKWYHADVCWDNTCWASVQEGYYQPNTMYWFLVSDDFMRKEGGAHAKWELSDSSTSEQFCDLAELPTCDTMLGDANGDLKRTKEDAEMIQKYLLNDKSARRIKLRNCDTNFSGTVEFSDVLNADMLATRISEDPLKGYANHSVKK